jgi:hypothetical protein
MLNSPSEEDSVQGAEDQRHDNLRLIKSFFGHIGENVYLCILLDKGKK